ncbi:hypothetical protein MKQ70_32210 [Chitinophaga sedimenti]|uniref:hypothetical protein n=1 Tax=Chitinophaga sedimenti TaxID=2033606 RepID=UPI0020040AF5|nr:hypothetical protein [Chitinophaga sedimenti]MCK7559382.1 hypothetical protein [Chitinophaga sedimenti]
MVIQPFVENAFIHGIGPVDYHGNIRITITRQAKTIRCVIEDNGQGLQAREQAIPGKTSLSTLITAERLNLMEKQTGTAGAVTIDDKANHQSHGVRVELTLPFRLVNS